MSSDKYCKLLMVLIIGVYILAHLSQRLKVSYFDWSLSIVRP